MLEAVRRIGRSVSSGDRDFVSGLVEYDSIDIEDNKENPLYILVINFNTIEDIIELEPKVLDNKRLDEYLWIGNAKGNLPQDRLTTDGLKYLLSDSLVNLYNELRECELKEILKRILNNFFITLRVRDRDVYILDLRKINFLKTNPEFTLPKEKNECDSYKDFVKSLKTLYEKTFFDIIKKYLGFDKKDIALFSITFDGKPPSLLPDYREYIEEKIIEESFKDGFDGICHICGQRDTVTYNTARFPVKFYITKLVTFSSELEGKSFKKGFSKNFTLCRDCYRDVVLGVKYIENSLSGELGGNDLWIIPGLFFNPIGEKLIEGWTEYSKDLTISTFTIDNFLSFEKRIEKELERYRKYKRLIDYSFVDLLFYEKNKKNKEVFKIRELIKDVPLRKVEYIREAIRDTQKLGDDVFGEDRRWFIGLDNIYYLIPIRRGKGSEYKRILDLYEDIFLAHRVDRKNLIDSFVALFGVYRFEKFAQYNIRPPQSNVELSMVFAILKTNLLLKLFERLGMLTGGESMNESFEGILDKDIE
ncbi:MAG: TIGR02556 family CRISPR-associated protein, partial [bacterium]